MALKTQWDWCAWCNCKIRLDEDRRLWVRETAIDARVRLQCPDNYRMPHEPKQGSSPLPVAAPDGSLVWAGAIPAPTSQEQA